MDELDELTQKLTDIEHTICVKTANMNKATTGADQRIAHLEHDLKILKEHRMSVAEPFILGLADDNHRCDEIKAQIIDAWDSEKKGDD